MPNKNITIRPLEANEIDKCRELCNELMAFQKTKAVFKPEFFDNMSYETRMKPGYAGAMEKQVLLIEDAGTPVGYAFNTVDIVTEEAAKQYPKWVGELPNPEKIQGFYPSDTVFPAKIGFVNNLYFHPEYRGMGLGPKMVKLALEWFKTFGYLDGILVHVSNGNSDAQKMYEKCGFAYDHDTFGGFITTLKYPMENL